MGIIQNQKVTISLTGNNKKHFFNKGYNVENKKKIEVNVGDLPEKSTIKVICICDYCGKETIKSYGKVNNQGNVSCSTDCAKIKQRETNLKKYGVEYPSKSKLIKDKIKNTCLEKYGVENVYQSEEIKEKIKEKNLNNLGVEYPSQSSKVKEKIKQSYKKNYGVDHISKSDLIKNQKKQKSLEKYGVDNPWKSNEVKQKIKETLISRYDVDNPMKNKDIKDKALQKSLSKGKYPSSKQQRYLCELLNGDLNKFINNCICDIVLKDKKIVVEYDGGGHWLSVKLGLSMIEFNKKEKNREKRILKCGYKIIRVISRNDLIPREEELISLLNKMFNELNEENLIIKLDIDNKKIIYNNKIENIQINNLIKIK